MRHCHFKQFLVLSHANDLCDKVWLGDMAGRFLGKGVEFHEVWK